MTRRLNFWLFVVFLIVALPYYWLLIDDRPGEVEAKPLAIRQLRDAAARIPGAAPVDIRFESASARRIPRIVLAAGQGIRPTSVEMRSYRLEYPFEPPIMIEGGVTIVEAAGFRFEDFEADALRKMATTRRAARLVVSLGADRARDGTSQDPPASPRQARDEASCSGPRALAPGLVEIPICDRVVARRMIYVRLAGGEEYLLTGDIAPTAFSVTEQAGPSRLMNDFHVRQDRKALHAWLRAIRRITGQAPDLTVIPGHDRLQYGQMRRGFDEP